MSDKDKTKIAFVMKLLDRQFGVSAEATDFGYESILLDRDELDTALLPDYFDALPTEQTVLLHFYNMNEYVVYIITDVKNNRWYLVGILKSGKLAYSQRCEQ